MDVCRSESTSQEWNGSLPGKLSQSSLIEVICFFSPIFSYLCLLVATFNPCQGKPPLRKYIKTCPSDSKSSRRDCSANTSVKRRNTADQTPMSLTSAKMGVDAHVPCWREQAFSFAIRYMPGFRMVVMLSHAEIDHVDYLVDHDQPTLNPGERRGGGSEHSPSLPFVPGRPIRKWSGLISR